MNDTSHLSTGISPISGANESVLEAISELQPQVHRFQQREYFSSFDVDAARTQAPPVINTDPSPAVVLTPPSPNAVEGDAPAELLLHSLYSLGSHHPPPASEDHTAAINVPLSLNLHPPRKSSFEALISPDAVMVHEDDEEADSSQIPVSEIQHCDWADSNTVLVEENDKTLIDIDVQGSPLLTAAVPWVPFGDGPTLSPIHEHEHSPASEHSAASDRPLQAPPQPGSDSNSPEVAKRGSPIKDRHKILPSHLISPPSPNDDASPGIGCASPLGNTVAEHTPAASAWGLSPITNNHLFSPCFDLPVLDAARPYPQKSATPAVRSPVVLAEMEPRIQVAAESVAIEDDASLPLSPALLGLWTSLNNYLEHVLAKQLRRTDCTANASDTRSQAQSNSESDFAQTPGLYTQHLHEVNSEVTRKNSLASALESFKFPPETGLPSPNRRSSPPSLASSNNGESSRSLPIDQPHLLKQKETSKHRVRFEVPDPITPSGERLNPYSSPDHTAGSPTHGTHRTYYAARHGREYTQRSYTNSTISPSPSRSGLSYQSPPVLPYGRPSPLYSPPRAQSPGSRGYYRTGFPSLSSPPKSRPQVFARTPSPSTSLTSSTRSPKTYSPANFNAIRAILMKSV